jgi:hypothetical protein
MGRTGRIEGITGGNPQRTAPARAAGSRVPTSGAIGAQPAAGSSARQVGRTAPAVNGVVGTPRNTASSTGRNSTGGFTQGGAGLVRGPAGSRNSEEPRDQEGSKRPDYLTEDEETWTAGRPGTVPPVIG